MLPAAPIVVVSPYIIHSTFSELEKDHGIAGVGLQDTSRCISYTMSPSPLGFYTLYNISLLSFLLNLYTYRLFFFAALATCVLTTLNVLHYDTNKHQNWKRSLYFDPRIKTCFPCSGKKWKVNKNYAYALHKVHWCIAFPSSTLRCMYMYIRFCENLNAHLTW